jgi:16S rRNA (cytosine1402-N4)-methyltransferase
MPGEVVHFLEPRGTDVIVDATLGGGGHAEKILSTGAFTGTLVGIDADREALEHARGRLRSFGERVNLVHGNFSHLRELLSSVGLMNASGVLMDLGVSSHQLDEAGRGFSFQQQARLDMRMDPSRGTDALSFVNGATREELSDVIRRYGEERAAKRIAGQIVEARQRKPLETTTDLARVVGSAVSTKFAQKTLARVFQAIRIAVNDELRNLERALAQALSVLLPGGRLVVITYHSLEDGIVKKFMREHARTFVPSGHKLVPDTPVNPELTLLTRKPVVPSPAEIAQNPRSRSAKLRAAERNAL